MGWLPLASSFSQLLASHRLASYQLMTSCKLLASSLVVAFPGQSWLSSSLQSLLRSSELNRHLGSQASIHTLCTWKKSPGASTGESSCVSSVVASSSVRALFGDAFDLSLFNFGLSRPASTGKVGLQLKHATSFFNQGGILAPAVLFFIFFLAYFLMAWILCRMASTPSWPSCGKVFIHNFFHYGLFPPGVRTTFGGSDVEKVHAVVACGRDCSELACGFSARVVAIGTNGTHAVMRSARVLTARVASDRVGRDTCSETWDTCSVMQFPAAEVCGGQCPTAKICCEPS